MPLGPAVLPPFPPEGEDFYATLVGGAPVVHDSAALLDDGRVIYQYGAGGDDIHQAYYPSWFDFGSADNASATTPYDIAAQVESTGLGLPRTTLFRMADGGLYMALIAGIDATGGRAARIYKSASGTGESSPGTSDWEEQSEIWSAGGFDSFEWHPASIGRPYAFGDRWVMSVSRGFEFVGVPIFHQAIYTSEDGAAGPWTLRLDKGYYIFGGSYGYGQSRQFADMDGTIVWGSTGNVEGAYCAYSTDGLSWSDFTVGGNSATADPLFYGDGKLYRVYSVTDDGGSSWPETNFDAHILETDDATTPASAGDIILQVDMFGDEPRFTQQYAVEGPPGEWVLIYRGQILVKPYIPPCVPVHPEPLRIPYKSRLHDLARDFTEAGIQRAIEQQYQNLKVIEQWAYRWMTLAGSADRCQLSIPYKNHSAQPPTISAAQSFENWKVIERWTDAIASGACGCNCTEFGVIDPPERCRLRVPFKDCLTLVDLLDHGQLLIVAEAEFANHKALELWADRFTRGECGCRLIDEV